MRRFHRLCNIDSLLQKPAMRETSPCHLHLNKADEAPLPTIERYTYSETSLELAAKVSQRDGSRTLVP